MIYGEDVHWAFGPWPDSGCRIDDGSVESMKGYGTKADGKNLVVRAAVEEFEGEVAWLACPLGYKVYLGRMSPLINSSRVNYCRQRDSSLI